jgi:KUP system potassium uptake protein
LGNDCWQVIIKFGFLDDPDVPKALEQINDPKFQYDPMMISYFLSRDILVPTLHKEMAPWRESLFAQMHRSASGAANFLRLPSNKVVELGSRVEF